MLLEMKCDFGQGWYLGKPATLTELQLRFAKPSSATA
jgi:EAL domain-containing protein (putative c-di-GMP-specific phosphodiesterase class I)